jgi:hypothetical protein
VLETGKRKLTALQLIASPLLIVVAIVMLVLSVRNLVLFAKGADIRDLAVSLENGFYADGAYLNRFTGQGSYVAGDCEDAETRARLTVSLAALDEVLKTDDGAAANFARKNAIEAAKYRLICNPLDGNAWLRYAMIDALQNGAVASVVAKLRWSYWSTPNEGWIMEARLPFATMLYSANAPGLEAEYLSDLWRYANYEPEDRVAANYVRTTPRVQALLRPLIEAQPDARKKAIVGEIDRLGVVLSPSNAQSPLSLSPSLVSPRPLAQ